MDQFWCLILGNLEISVLSFPTFNICVELEGIIFMRGSIKRFGLVHAQELRWHKRYLRILDSGDKHLNPIRDHISLSIDSFIWKDVIATVPATLVPQPYCISQQQQSTFHFTYVVHCLFCRKLMILAKYTKNNAENRAARSMQQGWLHYPARDIQVKLLVNKKHSPAPCGVECGCYKFDFSFFTETAAFQRWNVFTADKKYQKVEHTDYAVGQWKSGFMCAFISFWNPFNIRQWATFPTCWGRVILRWFWVDSECSLFVSVWVPSRCSVSLLHTGEMSWKFA